MSRLACSSTHPAHLSTYCMMGITNVWLDKIDPDRRISDGTFLMLLQAKTDFNIGHSSSNDILCIFPLRAVSRPKHF